MSTADRDTPEETPPAIGAFLGGAADEVALACAPDVLIDVNVPTWRFQLKGRDALRHILTEQEFLPGRTVVSWRSAATADGHLPEVETHAPIQGEQRRWREVVWLRTAGGAITEIVTYCTGIWDAETIARHASDAPMVIP